MRKRFAIFFMAMLFALIFCMPGYAATVCKIGSKGYSSLQKAVNAVEDGEVISLTKSVKTSVRVNIPAGKTFTIDFAKKKYICTQSGETAFIIGNNANVTMKNAKIEATIAFNVQAGSGKVATLTFQSGTVKAGHIVVSGLMFVKGGTFISEEQYNGPLFGVNVSGELTISKGTFSGRVLSNAGITTIKGGTFTNTGEKNLILNHGKLTVTKGVFRSDRGPNVDNEATLIIKGGDFSSGLTTIIGERGSKATISGGTFATASQETGNTSLLMNPDAKLTLKGGTFSSQIYISGTATISGGKSTWGGITCGGGKVTIKKFTADMPNGYTGACLFAENGTITVKGGSYKAPNGIGYKLFGSGKVMFSGVKAADLFQVKTLKVQE